MHVNINMNMHHKSERAMCVSVCINHLWVCILIGLARLFLLCLATIVLITDISDSLSDSQCLSATEKSWQKWSEDDEQLQRKLDSGLTAVSRLE